MSTESALQPCRQTELREFACSVLQLSISCGSRKDAPGATIIVANKPWDPAAGVLIARKSGAKVTDSRGERQQISSKETIASAPGHSSSGYNGRPVHAE